MTDYAKDVLVSADWVTERLDAFERDDPSLRLLEVDIDPSNYEEKHVPGATKVDWQTDLQDPTTFDILTETAFEQLVGDLGITETSTVVLYGDMMNWFAGYAYWLLSYYGHEDIRLLDGGRDIWIDRDYPLTSDVPAFTPQSYSAAAPNEVIRADRAAVEDAMNRGIPLIDVRTAEEYRGEILAPPGWNEGVQRGGHIPGAVNIPWSQVVDADGCFKPREALHDLYADADIKDEEVVVYCRIGERSALTWFVLHELLGYEEIRNYYGSWVEWGNTVGAPIKKGRRAGIRHE
jgi:thiosulfate/3-mercaptopyruvate sulfurtransferase